MPKKGLAKACAETGAQVSEYSAAPVFMDEHAKMPSSMADRICQDAGFRREICRNT